MATVTIDARRCKGCELCIAVCPRKLLVRSTQISVRGVHPVEVTDAHRCSGCLQCILVCPDVAITITETRAAVPAREGAS
jgi:2-oxoglutarate ferredoxin oxidoreductase subunit delta